MKAITKLISILLLAIMVLPLVQAQVAVNSFSLYPQKVLPGGETSIKLTLENVGSIDVKNVVVTMDLSQVPFVPIGSSNENVIERINSNDKETINFRVKALPDAKPSVYKIPVVISYEGATKNSLISIEVAANAHLDMLLDKSEVVKINDHGKITLKFVNDGLAKVKNLKVTLQESPLYDIISPNVVYIGEISMGDFETEDFTIIPKAKDPILAVDLEYRDDANNLFKESKLIKVSVHTEEEAKQLGLVPQQSLFFPIVAAVVVVGLVILYFRRKKKKKNAL